MKHILPFLLLMFGYINITFSQEVSLFTQNITQQEFLNPAYNSFKDYVSVNAFNRIQWGTIKNAPETRGLNIYCPIKYSSIGLSLNVINENIGLRTNTNLNLGISHNVRLSQKNYLSFGYSLGVTSNYFNRQSAILYPEIDLGLYEDLVVWDEWSPSLSMGAMFLGENYFAGLSSNATIHKTNEDKNFYLPGFDFLCGAIYELLPGICIKPGMLIKYYRQKQINNSGTVVKSGFIPPIIELSSQLFCLDRFWLGTSHRFNYAQTFSLDFLANKNITVGYTYELGVGEGYNRYDSHIIRLSYSIFPHNGRKGIVDDGAWYYNFFKNSKKSYLSRYIYR